MSHSKLANLTPNSHYFGYFKVERSVGTLSPPALLAFVYDREGRKAGFQPATQAVDFSHSFIHSLLKNIQLDLQKFIIIMSWYKEKELKAKRPSVDPEVVPSRVKYQANF